MSWTPSRALLALLLHPEDRRGQDRPEQRSHEIEPEMVEGAASQCRVDQRWPDPHGRIEGAAASPFNNPTCNGESVRPRTTHAAPRNQKLRPNPVSPDATQ